MQALKLSLGHARSKASDGGWLRAVSVVGVALAFATSTGASSAAETKARTAHLSFAVHTAAESAVSVWAMEFAKIVAQESNNTLLIEVHPGGKLVDQEHMFEALSSGKISIGTVGIPQLPNGPELVGLQYLVVPFAAPSWEDAIDIAQSGELRKVFNDALKPRGLRMLGMCTQGYSHFMSQTPFRTVADLAGQKVRQANADNTGAYVSALGAVPVTIPLNATYKALQDKTVTVVKSNVGNLYTLKWYQFAKYLDYIPMNHAFLPIMMNLKTYNQLSKSQQKTLEAVAASTLLGCDNAVQANEVEFIKRMEQEGVTVVKPDSMEEFEKTQVNFKAAGKATPLGRKVAGVIEGLHKKRAGKK